MSTSATWSSIERLRWTIADAADPRERDREPRLGDGVHRRGDDRDRELDLARQPRRVETSFGSTSDSAGTSRTSSNASPSRANFCSSSRSRSTSIRPSSSPSKKDRLAVGGDGLEVGDAGRPASAAEATRGGRGGRRRAPASTRAGGDRRAQRVLGRPPVELGRDEAGEQDVAAADRGDRLDLRRDARGSACVLRPSRSRAKQPVSFVISTFRAPSSAMCSSA